MDGSAMGARERRAMTHLRATAVGEGAPSYPLNVRGFLSFWVEEQTPSRRLAHSCTEKQHMSYIWKAIWQKAVVYPPTLTTSVYSIVSKKKVFGILKWEQRTEHGPDICNRRLVHVWRSDDTDDPCKKLLCKLASKVICTWLCHF